MKPRYWFRWGLEHGAVRALLRWQARRGDSFALLMGSADGIRDPYPHLEALCARGRLVPTPFTWVTTDYELCRAILRDNRFGAFTMDRLPAPATLLEVARSATLPASPVEPPAMLMIDPPEHTRLRKSVSAAFTPRAIGRLRDRVVSVTAELLDALPDNGSADLVPDFAAQVPIATISRMLGFPEQDREIFLGWGEQVTPLLDFGVSWRTWRGAAAAIAAADTYLDRHIAELRRTPGEDILSSLVTAGDLDDGELKATSTLLMGAGFKTTVNLIGNGVVQLLSHPEQLALLRAEPELWPQAVEEILRFDPPVQSTARVALCDVELDGVTLRAGSAVALTLAGANRDPKMFEEPNRFDITRPNAREHLAFSSGIHSCLGASLARMEGAHALRSLFERFPGLELSGTPQRRPLHNLHGYARMPVRLGHRAPAAA
ncbi:cytochrome P450 [Nocardia crassostreae]|uniref:cytochrome P450 n=1 Tax=Nocardia crassostreae TaxID=53428 RepID=UPI00082E408A|nr:cytochrome P450 [Nocardia crassostreae]